jgi:thiamine kinase-like enzyme
MAGFTVTYVAESDEQSQVFSPRIHSIFRRLEIAARMVKCKYEVASFEKYILEERPQVVFIDIITEDSDKRRLEACSQILDITRKFPDVLFVGLARLPIDVSRLGTSLPAYMSIASKLHLDNADSDGAMPSYIDYLAENIGKSVKRCSVQRITILESSGKTLVLTKSLVQGGSPVQSNIEIGSIPHSVVRGMCRLRAIKETDSNLAIAAIDLFSIIESACKDGAENHHINEVELSVLSGGYSGAIVSAVKLRNASSTRKTEVRGVLKMSRRKESIKEHSNYHGHVKWTLPYTWRVDVLGFGETAAIGGVCYSFVLSGSSAPIPVAECLRRGDSRAIELTLKKIFSPDQQTWYSTLQNTERKLEDYYFKKPFFRDINDIRHFQSRLNEILVEMGVKIDERPSEIVAEVGRKKFRLERLETLKTMDFGTLTQCISHGDMNANNMIVNDHVDSLAFIDFEKTGFWHVYRDFISFESSIRLDFNSLKRVKPDDADFRDRFAWESVLASAEFNLPMTGKIPEYIALVHRVRRSASLNHSRSFREYLLGTLVHHWWLLVRFYDELWTKKQRERLAAMVLASWCDLLERK